MEVQDAATVKAVVQHSGLDCAIQATSIVLHRVQDPALYHATASVLGQLDRTQDSFLRELGIDRAAALMDFNLAPLSMRRDIALLGMLHRAALRDGPPQLREVFKRRAGGWMLVDPLEGQSPSLLMRRSIWELIRVYNELGGSSAVPCRQGLPDDAPGMREEYCHEAAGR